MPKGYIVANIDIHDLEAWGAYRARSRLYVARNGGRYLVATDKINDREGSLGLKRLVIIEFPDLETALRVYEAEEYQREILPYRQAAATSDFVIVEGLD